MKTLLLLLVIPVLALTGCGTVEHTAEVTDPGAFVPDTRIIVSEVSNKTGETFDVDVEQMLRDAMVNQLSKENLLGNAGDPGVISMNVNIIEYRKGDAFKRWLWPGYGSTVLVIEATLLDAAGNVDATAKANRSVDAGGGYTIGAWKKIFDDVSADLVSDLKVSAAGTDAKKR
jgi:Domain of unknown function (DUF4410)